MVLDCVLRCNLKQWISRWHRQGLSWSLVEAVVTTFNKSFQSFLEYLEEVFLKVLQIVFLSKRQVSRRTIDDRTISS